MSELQTTSVRKHAARVQANPRRRRRVVNHSALAIVSVVSILVMFREFAPGGAYFRLSMATAYTSLALMLVTLLTGPWNVLRSRVNPVSSDIRRDLGIWAGLIGLVHVAVGLNVHFRGQMWRYFVLPAAERQWIPFRSDLFGFANLTGLLATIITLLLLALSNDFTLRRLGRRRWKMLQRSNYLLFGLVALHGLAYQWLEDRASQYVALLTLVVLMVVIFQVIAFRRHRRRLEAK